MANFCKVFQIDEINQVLVIVGQEGCGAAHCQCKKLSIEIKTRIDNFDLSVGKDFESADEMDVFFDKLKIEDVRDAWEFMYETAMKYKRMLRGEDGGPSMS